MKQLNPSRKFSLFAVAAIVSTLLVTTQLPLAAQNPVLDPSMTRLSVNLMHRIHNGFQVYWYAPRYNSDDVTDYDLQYREYNTTTSMWGTWTDKAHTGTSRMTLITGLTAGKKYQTRVRWWFGNRYSRWSIPQDDPSDTREARNYQSARQPDPPTLPTVTVSAGKFTVSWTNPGTTNNSVATTGYQVRWRASGPTGAGPLLPSSATSYDVTGLVDGVTYEVWVRAYAGSKWTGSPIAGRFTFQAVPPDPSTLTLSANPEEVTESASTTTVEVRATLDHAAKTGGVPVTLTAASGTTATASSDYTLPAVFTILEGETSATAYVTILNDNLVENQETLKLSATTTTSGITVTGTTVTINDDDAAASNAKIAFGNNAASTSEYTASVNENAGTVNVPVTISRLPAAPTTFAIEVLNSSTAGSGDYSISMKSVRFASNSSTTQYLQITITDDSIDDDSETIKLKIAAADAVANDLGDHYTRHSAGATATVTIADNDAPGITLSRNRVELTEAAGTNNSATYTVKLNTQPSDDVTISVSSGDSGAAAVSPSSRRFTSTNWDIAQTFTITAQSDTDADDETNFFITHSAASTDTSYAVNEYTDNTDKVAVTVTDDDAPGITLSKTRVELTEAAGTGNSDTYTVRLNTKPSDNVTISASSEDDGAAAVSPSSRIFTPDNWSTAQTFTVTAQSDTDADDETNFFITHSAASTDTSYAVNEYTATTDKVAVTVTDDDTTDDNNNGNNNNGNNNNGNNGNNNGDPPGGDDFTWQPSLRELEISSGGLHFDPDTFSYQVDVPHSTSVVTVTATPRSLQASITVNGRSTPRSRPSHEIVLSDDPTLISVIIRAKSGTTRAYTITVHRVDS